MVVGILVVLSLALLSVYFRESSDGPLHGAQDVGATAMRPFQVGAERVARPFRDLYGWFDGLLTAKDENERLREENARLSLQAIENETAVQENLDLKEQLDYQDLPGLEDYRSVNTRVLGEQSQFGKRLLIAAGSSDGVRLNAPVLSAGALVGAITELSPETAVVTLLTDESSAVAAYSIRTGALGLIQSGEGGSLAFANVTKDKDVARGDLVATAGSSVPRLPSLFPRKIPIGIVTSVSQTDTDSFKQIQLVSNVNLSNLRAVTVLVR